LIDLLLGAVGSGQSNMELPLQETFSWWTDFEATDAWSKANSKPFISNDTAYPIRTLQLGHNVQVRENASFCISFHIMMQTDDLTRQARDERKANSNKGGGGVSHSYERTARSPRRCPPGQSQAIVRDKTTAVFFPHKCIQPNRYVVYVCPEPVLARSSFAEHCCKLNNYYTSTQPVHSSKRCFFLRLAQVVLGHLLVHRPGHVQPAGAANAR
jgi:hypothetical protein